MFGVFIFLASFPMIINQILPVFVTQRTLYEARERPSKTYSWQSFLTANILVEMTWCSVRLPAPPTLSLPIACAFPLFTSWVQRAEWSLTSTSSCPFSPS